uniref:Activated CDC42 kinase 1 n=1 Tax=Aceria tosichella TaxID=561515 RepID=A0A6G1SIS4_9ACAR
MVGGKICIRFIDHNTHGTKNITKLLDNIEYVEQLVHSVLEDEGVKPVCKNLFGLKLTSSDTVWLAPNEPVKSLINWSRKRCLNGEPKLEIRMRFRPSCIARISLLDPTAFEVIYAQIYHDFMRTRFNEEKRELVLLNDSVLGLVTLNLIRHSVEKGISVEEILRQVRPKDFIPRRAPKWQILLLFHLAKQIKLQDSLRIGFEQANNDTHRIKQRFVELFLWNVATDYNCERYDVRQLVQTDKGVSKSELKQLKVRYNQSQEEATCCVEIRTKIKAKSNNSNNNEKRQDDFQERSVEVYDIETISHATLNDNQIQIVGSSSEPMKFQFESSWHAKSFLSCIDGYHRLMRKWNVNLCREIFSPELRYLAELGCHGPIGLETTKRKLTDQRRKDCYLLRKCMEHSNKFLIDTFICERVLLTIDVDWHPDSRAFKLTGHTTSLTGGLNVSVKTGQEAYSLLKTLINDTEIRIIYDLKNNSPPLVRVQQLKFMIYPKESDFYPALMLSMSMKALKERDNYDKPSSLEPTKLPVVIPSSSLRVTKRLYPVAENGVSVDLGTLNDCEQVVVKNCQDMPLRKLMSEFTFHYCPNGHADKDLERNIRPSQMRLADWLFIKSDLFAETIGFVMTGILVQEYFPLGRLDTFLRENANHEVSQLIKLSASFQLAQALRFLDDRQIIHGKIRCHNIMVKQTNPIHVQLTDPLGVIDIHRDQAFIPSEYFSSSVQVCVKRYYSGIDIWAAGTTMWQIFNHGVDPPPGRYANTLTQLNCPDSVWNLIEGCWIIEPNFRTSPRTLHRDLFELIAWEDGSHNCLHIRSSRDSGIPIDHQRDILATTNSSRSDLSILGNIDPSILSSPHSTCSENSRTHLLKPRIAPNNASQPEANHNIHVPDLSQYQILNGPASVNRRASSNWTNLINFRKAPKQGSRCDLPPQRPTSLSDIFGSRVSLGSCSTPSGSEITRSTDVIDSQSISEAFDRCVWHVDSHRLKLGAEIGRGSSGIVFKGVMSRTAGEEEVVAVKCIDRDCADLSCIEDLKREFDILKNLNHKNIVKTLGYVDESQMMLIFEYMPLGSLLSCIRNLSSHTDLFKLPLKKYALDIARGMEYLESRKIVHRDLALRNILLNDRDEVKICDFGLAQSLGSSSHYKLETERALPLKWYAPETLSTWVFTHKSDVWSYGVVLWEIYSGGDSPQYPGTYAYLWETLKHERLPMPPGCPRHMYDLMLACWVYEPDDRKSFEEIRVMLELHDDDLVN